MLKAHKVPDSDPVRCWAFYLIISESFNRPIMRSNTNDFPLKMEPWDRTSFMCSAKKLAKRSEGIFFMFLQVSYKLESVLFDRFPDGKFVDGLSMTQHFYDQLKYGIIKI